MAVYDRAIEVIRKDVLQDRRLSLEQAIEALENVHDFTEEWMQALDDDIKAAEARREDE